MRVSLSVLLNRAGAKPVFVALFLLCALPTGIMTAVLTPPGQVPDEQEHMVRIAGLLHGEILGVRKPLIDQVTGASYITAGVKADMGVVFAANVQVTQIDGAPKMTAADQAAMRDRPPFHERDFVMAPNTVTYFPAAYIPATIGLALALAVHASPHICMLAARFGALAGFLSLGAGAIWLIAFGEALLLALLLMPMTLFLAGSVNQDAMLIAFTSFAAAALTRSGRVWRWTAVIALGLFLAAKPPYLPLVGLLVLPFGVPGLLRRLRDALLVVVAVLLWVVPMEVFSAVPFQKGAYHPGPFWSGPADTVFLTNSLAANLHVLLASPSRFFTLPWTYLSDNYALALRQMVGVLGWLQIDFNPAIYTAWYVALLLALVGVILSRRPVAASGFNFGNAMLVLCLMLLACWGVMISFYLTWTNVGMAEIDGLQGRYIIPLLPFFCFALPYWRGRFNLPAILPALPAVAMGIFDLGYVPVNLVRFYYLH